VSGGRRIVGGVFDYIVRFRNAAGVEHTLSYRSHGQLREGAGIVPGSSWGGPLLLVTEVTQAASHGCVGSVRATPISESMIERRMGGDRRSGIDRRQISVLVAVERRSEADRRSGDRRARLLVRPL